MVNLGRNALQGEFYPSRDNWPRNDRQYMDIQDGRFNTPSVHGYPQAVEHALRECAQIPVKEFALIVMQDNGEQKTYSSTSLKLHWPKIFTERFKRDFRQCTRWANAEGSYPNSAYSQQEGMYDMEFDHEYRRQSTSGESSSEMPRRLRTHQSRSVGSSGDQVRSKRKRTRYLADADTIPPVQKYQDLVIGDEVEVGKFYFLRFKDLQQSSCKVMGKAFVKLVEPKKQTHHPYTKKEEGAPEWWPTLKELGEDGVKHREPDHLYRAERIRLLVHILRMIVEPNHKQPESIRKHELNVKTLEEVTWEATSNWFNDKEHPGNAAKRPFLKEIFKVARAEERYKNGELDPLATVPIMYGDRGADDSDSDEEEFKEEDLQEDENDNSPMRTNMSTSPESLVSSSMMQAPQQNSPFETDNQIQQRARPLIVSRHSQQPQPHIEDQAGYLDTNFSRSMSGYQTQSPNLQQDFRRSFHPTGFPSQQNMYSGSTGWQNNNMLSTSSMSTNYCVANSSQATLAPSTASFQLPPVTHVQQQPNMLPPPPMSHHAYNDGLPMPRHYEPGPALGHQLRSGHPHQMSPSQGFGDFMHDGSGFGAHDAEMKEEQHIRPS